MFSPYFAVPLFFTAVFLICSEELSDSSPSSEISFKNLIQEAIVVKLFCVK